MAKKDWSNVTAFIKNTKFADNNDTLPPPKEGPMYLTGSRFYKSDTVDHDTDYDFFGLKQHVEYWRDKLIEDGYEITTGEYFNRSYYAKKDGCVINLICVRDSQMKIWMFNTILVKTMFDMKLLKNNSKDFYVQIFELLCVILKNIKFHISDNLEEKLIPFTNFYPHIFDLHDITNDTFKTNFLDQVF